MKIATIALTSFLCLVVHQLVAGDAIAMAFNSDGVWTAVTYNRSSTPKGGPHYHKAAQACLFALRDLRVRAADDLAWTKIIGESDRTGYVTVARGYVPMEDTVVTAIGRGKSQEEADKKAMEKLSSIRAIVDQTIIYQYFSYGADSRPAHHSATKRSKQTHKVASKN
jgi:hypothetical protein